MPLKDVRHNSNYLRSDFIEQGNINHIRIFSAVAILVLIIACINYMNLSTAKSAQRAKEVGIRKVLGAFQKQLLTQFLFESIIISIISTLLGVVIVILTLPHMETLSGIRITEGLQKYKSTGFTGCWSHLSHWYHSWKLSCSVSLFIWCFRYTQGVQKFQ